MLTAIIWIILSSLILWLLYWYYKYSYFEKYLKTIPGPKVVPLLGNLKEFGTSTTVLENFLKLSRKYNGNFKLYAGTQPLLILVETKDLEFLLHSTTILTKSFVYKFVQNWLNEGLITSKGSRWKKHRRIITPAFHFQILEEFIDVFNSAGNILLSKLNDESKKGSFDIYPFITRYTLDVICETAMGTCVNAQEDLDSEYVKCVNMLLKIVRLRSFSPILSNDFLYRFTKTYRTEQYALNVVHGYTKSVINKRKQFLNNVQIHDESVDYFGRKKKRAFLDLLLEYSSTDPSFTEDDIRQEVDTFMFAGHDTTAAAISYTLFALAANPDVQKKAYAEIEAIFSDDLKRQPSYRDLQDMKYIEMVIKETLRLYSIVPLFSRRLEEDVMINGRMFPKGMAISVFTYGIHHDPMRYENPDKFDPQRFTTENSMERNSFDFVPFSAGSRNCIGQKFAMLELKSIVSKILKNFELHAVIPEHKLVLKSDVVLKPDNGVFIQLKRRNFNLL